MSTKNDINKILSGGRLSQPPSRSGEDPAVWYPDAHPTSWTTLRYAKWMGGGHIVTEDAFEALRKVVMKDATGSRSDGSARVRPSLIGGCVRKQAFSFLGLPSTRTREGGSFAAAVAGTWGHYKWQVAGLSGGWFNAIEVAVSDEATGVAGQIDAICTDNAIFELKTVASIIYNGSARFGPGVKKMPRTKDVMQVHAYMAAYGTDKARIVYEDRSSGDATEWTVLFSEPLYESLLETCDQVTSSTLATMPPPLEACKAKTGSDYKYCDWVDLCQPALEWDASRVSTHPELRS